MTPPAEPLSELRADVIRSGYKPGDYSVRRDGDGVEHVSGRCATCGEPVGEDDIHAIQLGRLRHGRRGCMLPPVVAVGLDA